MILIIFITLIGLCAAQICPPPEVLLPCRCESQGSKFISCSHIQDDFNLKEVLDNATQFIGDDVIFDTFVLRNTSLATIKEATGQHLKFEFILITDNSKLTYISPGAFNGSQNTTIRLDVRIGPINNEPPYERDIYDFIRSFKNLRSLDLSFTSVSSIPDGALQKMSALQYAVIIGNKITSIGSRPFSDIPTLTVIQLSSNDLTPDGLHEDAFDGITGAMDWVTLQCNIFDYMEQQRFQTLLDLNSRVFVGCDWDTEQDRFHCDERADWICDNEGRYGDKLGGFRCKKGTGYEDIWDYCRGRNITFNF